MKMKNNNFLSEYFELIISKQLQNEKIRWIYQSAYNYFFGVYDLTQNGLKNQAHNSFMGEENKHHGHLLDGFNTEYDVRQCKNIVSLLEMVANPKEFLK